MGNCLGSRSKEASGQRLGTSGSDAAGGGGGGNNTTHTLTSNSGQKPSSDREAMLAAAEQRRQKAENRGVVKQDGKLSKQLAEQNRQNPLLGDNSKDMPERIVYD